MNVTLSCDAPKALRQAFDSITPSEEQRIRKEANDTFLLSMGVSAGQNKDELVDEWDRACKTISAMASFQAKVMDSKNPTEEEVVSLKEFATQIAFFTILLGLTNGVERPKKLGCSGSLNKVEGESEEEHLDRLKKYIAEKENELAKTNQ